MSAYALPAEAYAPTNDPEQRFRLYLRSGDDLRLKATGADVAAIGQAIQTQDEDARAAGHGALYDLGKIGIMDAAKGRWIVLPFDRGETR